MHYSREGLKQRLETERGGACTPSLLVSKCRKGCGLFFVKVINVLEG